MTTSIARNKFLRQEPEEDKSLVATQWQLMWWKFRRHKLAVASGVVIILLYGMALFCEFLSIHRLF